MMFHKKFEIFLACLLGFFISSAQDINQVTIVNESTINSSDLEFSPAFYEDGIVFISTRDAGPKLGMKDIRADMNNFSVFWAQRDINGILKTPLPFSNDINTRFNEGPLTFSRTQDEVYFCRTVISNGKEVKSSNGVSRMNIYMAEKKGTEWVGALGMPFNDINYDYVHPAISVTGDKLYGMGNNFFADWSATPGRSELVAQLATRWHALHSWRCRADVAGFNFDVLAPLPERLRLLVPGVLDDQSE